MIPDKPSGRYCIDGENFTLAGSKNISQTKN